MFSVFILPLGFICRKPSEKVCGMDITAKTSSLRESICYEGRNPSIQPRGLFSPWSPLGRTCPEYLTHEVPGGDPNQISEPPEPTRRMIGSSTLNPSDMNELFTLFLAHSNIWRHRKQPSDPLGNTQSAGIKPTRIPTTFWHFNQGNYEYDSCLTS